MRLMPELRNCDGPSVRPLLRRAAEVGSSLLRMCGGHVDVLVSRLGRGWFASHIDVAWACRWFGGVKQFPHIDRLLHVLEHGVPVDVVPGGVGSLFAV